MARSRKSRVILCIGHTSPNDQIRGYENMRIIALGDWVVSLVLKDLKRVYSAKGPVSDVDASAGFVR